MTVQDTITALREAIPAAELVTAKETNRLLADCVQTAEAMSLRDRLGTRITLCETYVHMFEALIASLEWSMAESPAASYDKVIRGMAFATKELVTVTDIVRAYIDRGEDMPPTTA